MIHILIDYCSLQPRVDQSSRSRAYVSPYQAHPFVSPHRRTRADIELVVAVIVYKQISKVSFILFQTFKLSNTLDNFETFGTGL